jgi:hypothetical protein
MMDEAFLPFSEIIRRTIAFRGEIVDEAAGVRSYIYTCDIEMPVELDITRDESGQLHIGSTPPLYYVDTSFRPSYHRLKFTASLAEERDGDD